MNWDMVFFSLSIACFSIAGMLATFGPFTIEMEVRYEDRQKTYKVGIVVVVALIIAGALLLGLGVPTG